MATFTEISMQDMASFLTGHGFVRVFPPRTVEAVYGKRVYCQNNNSLQLTLRVFTSITDRAGTREVGTDAIRVVLFYRQIIVDDVGNEKALEPCPIGGSRRVHRVKGWKNNLQRRLDEWADMIGPSCPKCGQPMVERNGSNGPFYGCIGFRLDANNNQCRATLPMGDVSVASIMPSCPKCGKATVLRQGRHDKFVGCSAYPACNYAASSQG